MRQLITSLNFFLSRGASKMLHKCVSRCFKCYSYSSSVHGGYMTFHFLKRSQESLQVTYGLFFFSDHWWYIPFYHHNHIQHMQLLPVSVVLFFVYIDFQIWASCALVESARYFSVLCKTRTLHTQVKVSLLNRWPCLEMMSTVQIKKY